MPQGHQRQTGLTDKSAFHSFSSLSPLAEALQVSTGALLNGQENDRRSPEEPPTDKREEQLSLPEEERLVKNTLRYADRVRVHKWEALSGKIVLVLLLASLVAMAVCLICDVAVTGGVSWSPPSCCSAV